MTKFKEMDQQKILELIKGYPNFLKMAETKEQEHFKNSSCPKCSSTRFQTFVDAKNPFSPGKVLPNKILQCLQCKTEFKP